YCPTSRGRRDRRARDRSRLLRLATGRNGNRRILRRLLESHQAKLTGSLVVRDLLHPAYFEGGSEGSCLVENELELPSKRSGDVLRCDIIDPYPLRGKRNKLQFIDAGNIKIDQDQRMDRTDRVITE